MKSKILTIYLICIFMFVADQDIWANDSQNMLLNEKKVNQVLNIEPFEIIKSEEYQFPGALRVKDFGPFEELFIIAGKYKNKVKSGHLTFVAFLSKTQDGIKKEQVINFYTPKIDFLMFEDNLVYVVFTAESDYFGWIKWENESFHFVFNPERNL